MTRCKNSTNQLRRTFNNLETQLRSLESLGENTENKYMVALILSKFPTEFNLKLEESRENEWTVKDLRTKVRRLIVAREKSEEIWNKSDIDDRKSELDEFLLSKDVKVSCVFCRMNHWHDECQKYKTMTKRKAQIKGRCFVCLSPQHFYRQCKSEKPCFFAGQGNHHSSLCPSKFGDQNETNIDGNFNNYTEENLIGDEIMINVSEKIIMKTAKVCMRNSTTGKVVIGTAMLDTGEKLTYITAEKAKSLGLKFGSSRVVQLNTFGNTNPTEVTTSETICYRYLVSS